MFDSPYRPLREITDVAEDLGLDLEPGGGSEWKCCCPVHGDTVPSMFINEEMQVWFCHGCDLGGNALTLATHMGASEEIAFDGTAPMGIYAPARLRTNDLLREGKHLAVRFAALAKVIRSGRLDAQLVRAIDIAATTKDDDTLQHLLNLADAKLWSVEL